MNRKLMYLLLCVLGIALPYSQFIPWTVQNGLHMKYFMQQLFANRVGGFFGLDVLVSAVVLFYFVIKRANGFTCARSGFQLLQPWLSAYPSGSRCSCTCGSSPWGATQEHSLRGPEPQSPSN